MIGGDDPIGCDQLQLLLRDAARGRLDRRTRDRLCSHLAACSTCARIADEERTLDRLLEERLPQPTAPLALRLRVHARLELLRLASRLRNRQ
jgi:anti-sigma factor (TIGR02949 family)